MSMESAYLALHRNGELEKGGTALFEAEKHETIARRITGQEYRQAVDKAKRLGLTNVEIQVVPLSLL